MSNPYGNVPGVTGEFLDVPFVYRQICEPLPAPETRVVEATEAEWCEFGFVAGEELTGNAADGWVDAAGEVSWKIQSSVDLVNWSETEMADAAVTGIDNLDGTFSYWARRAVPLVWNDIMIDLTIGSDRYGKSITDLTLFQTAISLPNYPYAMPSEAAALQADLRAAGYTGATVTSSSASLVARVKNHISTGTTGLVVTMSGADVTAVNFYGDPAISLPGYPYTMPADRAALQTDLRANGVTGAVVMLYQDPWQIFLPNRIAVGRVRDISLTIDPGDPFPSYDFFGNYQGEAPANSVTGTSGNVRTPAGAPLLEAPRCFFRVVRRGLPI